MPDALGSVRATLDGAGTVLASTSYDPWGLPQAGAIAPFGFTGEVQHCWFLEARHNPLPGNTCIDQIVGYPAISIVALDPDFIIDNVNVVYATLL